MTLCAVVDVYDRGFVRWDTPDAPLACDEGREPRVGLELQSARLVEDHRVDVYRVVGSRLYVVLVDGSQLPGTHDWTIDAVNAGLAEVCVLRCAARNVLS